MRTSALFAAFALMAQAASNYTAERSSVDGVEVIRLGDTSHKIQVSIAPSYGNNAYEMNVNGVNVFWTPTTSPAEMKAKPRHLGNPFLAPWANRLDQDGFYANGKYYRLNPELKNFGRDPNKQPIHGLLVYSSQWQVIEAKADDGSAWVTSRLEFWRYPDLMAQFPFAHTIDMTYRLQDGVLEVATKVTNHAKEPMPVSIAYHPYFKVQDAPRDEWRVQLPVREHLTLSERLIPTGEVTPASYPDGVSLAGKQLDDVFSGLIRGESGRAEFSVQGKAQKVSVLYGPKYKVAVVYAPAGRDFICFEPMTGPTNAFNNGHAGKYGELQSIAPGDTWAESFWIQPTGFAAGKSDARIRFESITRKIDDSPSTPDVRVSKEGDTTIVTIFAGEKRTGGYSVEVTGVEKRGGVCVVSYRVNAPARDAMLAQVLTYPHQTVRIHTSCDKVELSPPLDAKSARPVR